MKNFRIIFFILLTASIVSSCRKDNGGDGDASGTAHLNLYLTDAPALYDAVFIDIESIEIISDAGTATFPLLVPGIYNLLDFTSGIDTLMISEDMSPRTISQIRLILGENNSIVVGGIAYPLSTPSAQSSGLKLQVHETLEPGITYAFYLDFDAEHSIVEEGNGSYSLKPVLNIFTDANTGTISGIIFPPGGAYYVNAFNGSDSSGTYISVAGTFLITGLSPGTYNVAFTPASGFSAVTISGVAVIAGSTADIGTITIP